MLRLIIPFLSLGIPFMILSVLAVFLAPGIFYVLTLQKALKKCAPESRTLDPGLLWLYLIPVVNLVFHFFIVVGMAKSLRNEFTRRGIAIADRSPGQALGLAMCIVPCCCILPVVGWLLTPVLLLTFLILWIVYWVKIAGFSGSLGDVSPMITPSIPASEDPALYGAAYVTPSPDTPRCGICGNASMPEDRFCETCGSALAV